MSTLILTYIHSFLLLSWNQIEFFLSNRQITSVYIISTLLRAGIQLDATGTLYHSYLISDQPKV